MSHNPMILCENLVKIYKVAEIEVVALQGLDLSIRAGEMVGVVGASGSGKSTLMSILGGLDRPTAGRVWVNGQDLLKMSDRALDRYRCTQVGFVWQQGARNLVPFLTTLENVELPILVSGEKGRSSRQRAEELLVRVGLADRHRHRLAELSGGEQQRVAIAVALANHPSLLLADEPTGEVDSAAAACIYQIFQELNAQLGLTILIVSHDPGLARYIHRIVAIRDGKLSSETIKRPVQTNDIRQDTAQSASQGEPDREEGVTYEELVVLDTVGRLQIPKDYLARYQIRQRARLEQVEDGILIRPAGNIEPSSSDGAPPVSPRKAAPGMWEGLKSLAGKIWKTK